MTHMEALYEVDARFPNQLQQFAGLDSPCQHENASLVQPAGETLKASTRHTRRDIHFQDVRCPAIEQPQRILIPAVGGNRDPIPA